MFSPVFQITNKTLTSLINLEVSRKIVDLAPLETDWEVRLRLESLIKRVFAMVRFLDNNLSLDDIAKIVKDDPGRDDKASEVAMRVEVVGKEKDIQQVMNILNANKLSEQIAYLSDKFKQSDYGERDLIKLNSLLGEKLSSTTATGVYRQTNGSNESSLPVVPVVEIPFQVEDLFGWFGGVGKNNIHPVLRAGTMFYELVRICPFQNNNLISAFCFTNLILSSEGYHLKRMWTPEEEILKNKESYLVAVDSVARNRGDLSLWLERFTRWGEESAEKTKIKVMNLIGDAPIFKSDGGKTISLSERQISIMEEMTIRNEMTIKEIRTMLPMISDDTILRDLKDLIAKKLIRKRGKTKGALYLMGKVRSYR